MRPEEVQDELNNLLGRQGMDQFYQLGRGRRPHRFIAEAAGALAFTDSPLTPDQSDQLTQIMNSNAMRGGYNWDGIIAQSQAILSPPQQAMMAGLQAEDAEQAQYQLPRTRQQGPSAR